MSQSLPSTIYASISDESNPVNGNQVLVGVYKTTDGGVNWQRLGTPPNYVPDFLGTQGGYDNVIVVSPTNPNEVILAGDGTGAVQATGAVLLTTNGGATFTDITTANGTSPHTDDHAGEFDSNGNFLMGCDGGFVKYTFGAKPKWSSLNGTNTSSPTVTALNTIQFYSVAISPTDANFALGGSQDNGTAQFDDNIGWTQTDGGDGEKVIYDYDNPLHALHVIPLASGGVADYLKVSDDGGLTWTPYAGTIGNLNVNERHDLPLDPNHRPVRLEPLFHRHGRDQHLRGRRRALEHHLHLCRRCDANDSLGPLVERSAGDGRAIPNHGARARPGQRRGRPADVPRLSR